MRLSLKSQKITINVSLVQSTLTLSAIGMNSANVCNENPSGHAQATAIIVKDFQAQTVFICSNKVL